MLTFTAALHCEAAPLIDLYKLKRDAACREFELFANEDTFLIISKVGRVRSAIATTHLLARQEALKECVAVNIGTCGANKSFPLWQPILANKISCAQSKRTFFSDIYLRHNFKEAHLETFDSAVFSENEEIQCVDMEAHGFFEAAATFLPASQIYSIKIVSDYLSQEKLNPSLVSMKLAEQLPQIKIFLDSVLSTVKSSPNPLSAADEKLLKDLARNLNFSRYQTYSLMKLALSFKVRSGCGLDVLSQYIGQSPSNKLDAKAAFIKVQNALSAF